MATMHATKHTTERMTILSVCLTRRNVVLSTGNIRTKHLTDLETPWVGAEEASQFFVRKFMFFLFFLLLFVLFLVHFVFLSLSVVLLGPPSWLPSVFPRLPEFRTHASSAWLHLWRHVSCLFWNKHPWNMHALPTALHAAVAEWPVTICWISFVYGGLCCNDNTKHENDIVSIYSELKSFEEQNTRPCMCIYYTAGSWKQYCRCGGFSSLSKCSMAYSV